MFSLGMVICSIYNNGKGLIQAQNSTSAYLKQLETVSRKHSVELRFPWFVKTHELIIFTPRCVSPFSVELLNISPIHTMKSERIACQFSFLILVWGFLDTNERRCANIERRRLEHRIWTSFEKYNFTWIQHTIFVWFQIAFIILVSVVVRPVALWSKAVFTNERSNERRLSLLLRNLCLSN